MRCEHFKSSPFKSIDIEVSGKTATKVSSILLPIPRHESIVDTDIDTTKVSSIVSMSILIFDINNTDFDVPRYAVGLPCGFISSGQNRYSKVFESYSGFS